MQVSALEHGQGGRSALALGCLTTRTNKQIPVVPFPMNREIFSALLGKKILGILKQKDLIALKIETCNTHPMQLPLFVLFCLK